MKTVLSGMRATSRLHLGNYFGAAANWLRMQEEYNCYFFVADLHALTTDHNPTALNSYTKTILAHYLGLGLDPEKSTLYIQSDVPEIIELYLVLNMFANKGELEKTASFKEKARKKGQSLNAGLLTYPVLMAADILIHRADFVPVGKDQEQHLEMTRTFGNRFNHVYKTDLFPEPQAFAYTDNLVKIYALDGSGQKMSKSDHNMNNTIFLTDTDEEIRKKLKKAKTDSGPTEKNSPISQEVKGLFELMEGVSKPDTLQAFKADYADCSIRYGDFKTQLATDVIDFIAPKREEILSWQSDEVRLHRVAQMGADKARESARKTLRLMREVMGMHYIKN